MESLRAQLRADTRSLHDTLEARLPITRGEVDVDVYRDHLAFLWGFHAPLEEELSRCADLRRRLPDFDRRLKSESLRADLGSMKLVDTDPADLPCCSTSARALGVLYVIEGAGRGAKVLLRDLQRDRVIPGPIGSAYLEGYGAAEGGMWKKLCDALELIPEPDRVATRRAAEDTFSALIDWRDTWTRR